MEGLKELKGTKHGHRVQQYPSSLSFLVHRPFAEGMWGLGVQPKQTPALCGQLSFPKAPSRLCYSHQSSVYAFSHLSFCLPSTQPSPIYLTTHQLATQTAAAALPNSAQRSPETPACWWVKKTPESPGEGRRQETSS